MGAEGGPPAGRGAEGGDGGPERAAGAGGSVTGAVVGFGAAGGSGAEGNWIGAVARRAVGGWMELVVFVGTEPVEGDTGAVASRGWVTPAPGRARRVIRTVSFFNGTAEVFGVEVGV